MESQPQNPEFKINPENFPHAPAEYFGSGTQRGNPFPPNLLRQFFHFKL